MANRSVVETGSKLNSNIKIKNGAKATNGKVNTKIAFNLPRNGTVTIKENTDENTKITIRVRRRTRIRRV